MPKALSFDRFRVLTSTRICIVPPGRDPVGVGDCVQCHLRLMYTAS